VIKKICCIGPVNSRVPIARNSVLYAGLAACGVELSFIRISDVGTRGAASVRGPAHAMHKRFWLRLLPRILWENVWLFLRCLVRIRLICLADILLVPSYGNYCVFAVKIFSWLFGKPLVLDAHGSLYFQRIVGARDFPDKSVYARFLFWLDRCGAICADCYITLSHEYKRVLAERFALHPDKFLVVYVGTLKTSDPDFFPARAEAGGSVDVLYWGSFKFFDGVENILRAAALLRDQGRGDIRFVISGRGAHERSCHDLRARLKLHNVKMVGWVKEEQLAAYIQQAKVCLGPMGDNFLRSMDFPNKVCEGAAFGKAMVLIDGRSMSERFAHLESAIFCPSPKPEDIAKSILLGLDDEGMRVRAGKAARKVYEAHLTPAAVAGQFLRGLEQSFGKGANGTGKKLIFVKGFGGFGNRILALLEALLYARISGRKVIVDWTDGMYAPRGVNAFDLFFQSPVIDPAENPASLVTGSHSVTPSLWKDRVGLSWKEVVTPISWEPEYVRRDKPWNVLKNHPSEIDHPEDVLVWLSWMFREEEFKSHRAIFPKEWIRLKDDSLKRKIFTDSLALAKDIVDQADLFERQHFSGSVIGVHVRFTDNRTTFFLKKVRPPEAYFPVIEDLMRNLEDAKIFLCSDNKSVVEMFQKRYNPVIARDKYFSPEGSAIHSSKECADKIKMGKDALVEMLLLSRCQHLIHGGSTFTKISRLMAPPNAQEAHIIKSGVPGWDMRQPGRRALEFLKEFISRQATLPK